LNEILCNALDKDDASEISIDVQVDGEFDRLTIADNGSKRLSRSDLELIFDFENKSSSKRGFLRVSRGYLGNALKCIFGYSYALAESKGLTPPSVTVTSGQHQYTVCLKPDRIHAVINHTIDETDRQDDGYTAFTVKFPRDEGNLADLKELVDASSMVNPARSITCNLYGDELGLGATEEGRDTRRETSASWYTVKQFTELYEDFLRTSPDAQLQDFIAMFRGFRRRNAVRDILQELGTVQCTLPVQFVPTSTLKDLSSQHVEKLLAIMKAKSKPIGKRSIPAVLGSIGRDSLQNIKERNGWPRLRYIILAGEKGSCPTPHWGDIWNENLDSATWEGKCENPDHVVVPYLVELAVIDRGDSEGLRVYQCVNFMAPMEPVFSSSFDVKYRLGRVGINTASSVTIIVHLVCPVLPWLNYGKNALANIDSCRLIEKAFDKLLPIPKAPREYHPPPPPRPYSWVPHGKLGDEAYEIRLKLFAEEVLVINRQRTFRIKWSSRGWCYILEGERKIDKGEFDACQKTINDCRKADFLPIDFTSDDPDETRHFKGIHSPADPAVLLRQIKTDVQEMLDSLPSNITDYWKDEKYYVMMCVEKGDMLTVFRPICNEYHVPIVSSRGWSALYTRNCIAKLAMKAEALGLIPVLLLFYDHDSVGLRTTQKFRKHLKDCERGTHYDPSKLIIERFGLNKEDIDKYGLTWIENLQTSSGRESTDYEYIEKYGRRKCESNALLKSDATLKAAEQICRHAIEKYYGIDAKDRFRRKEEQSRGKLGRVYDNPVWADFDGAIASLLDSFAVNEETEAPSDYVPEKETDVLIDDKFYGTCPNCDTDFNYSEEDVGRLVRCRNCNLPMRLKLKQEDP
jgi:hypothetical protein